MSTPKNNSAETVFYVTGETSLGRILVGTTEHGVSAILLGDDDRALVADVTREFPNAKLVAATDQQAAVVSKVIDLIEEPSASFDLPLDIRGTDFQRSVWAALGDVKGGTTASYKEIATKIGAPEAVRAVARACAANRLAIAIPCHRVVAANGDISGYRWGVDRKQALLNRERA
jgi:AraC family transcriptional regulator of adaptative response/methylated-DNA-[protein]-cysteine methyltransferase